MKIIKADSATGIFSRMKGLIGGGTAKTIFLKTRFGIHTFGLKFPIDVIILDGNFRVMKTRSGLGINSCFFWNPRWKNVIELPCGEIKRRKIAVGEELKIIPISHG